MRVKKGVMVLLLLAFVCFSPSYSKVVETAGKMEPQVILVLDAGHGGMDGGAIGGDGTKEQKIRGGELWYADYFNQSNRGRSYC